MFPAETTSACVLRVLVGFLSEKPKRRGNDLLRGESAFYFLICRADSAQIWSKVRS